jgi:hypothetical protein
MRFTRIGETNVNVTTLIVLAWLFGAVNLTKEELIDALDGDTENDLEDFDFGMTLFIADLNTFMSDARKLALRQLIHEVNMAIQIYCHNVPGDQVRGMPKEEN